MMFTLRKRTHQHDELRDPLAGSLLSQAVEVGLRRNRVEVDVSEHVGPRVLLPIKAAGTFLDCTGVARVAWYQGALLYRGEEIAPEG